MFLLQSPDQWGRPGSGVGWQASVLSTWEGATVDYLSLRLSKKDTDLGSYYLRSLMLYIFSSRIAQRMLLCNQELTNTPPVQSSWWGYGSYLVSDLEEGLKLSKWEQYWLQQKRLLGADVSMFLVKTGLPEAHPWSRCSSSTQGPSIHCTWGVAMSLKADQREQVLPPWSPKAVAIARSPFF